MGCLFLSALLATGFSVHPTVPSFSAVGSRSATVSCVAAADLSELGLTPYLEKTVKGMQLVPDQKLRYQQLLFLAKKLPPMDAALQVDENKVPGCLSTVHVHATLEDDKIRFVGESDAQLTKGLVALLVMGLDGCTNEQIQRVQPEFIKYSGLAQSLTPGRNNGFLNMLNTMKLKAAALTGAASASPPPPSPPPPPPASRAASPTMLAAVQLGPVGTRMQAALAEAFAPSRMSLVDESHQHAGHAGAKGLNGESHFNLLIESEAFSGVRGLKRHQMVYAALGDDMKAIHALSIKAVAPGEPS